MSHVSFLADAPPRMWDQALGARDLEAQLDRARDFGVARLNEIELANEVLDTVDPAPEPGEPLDQRLRRVLATRLAAVED